MRKIITDDHISRILSLKDRMSQKEIARAVGVSQFTVNKVVNAKYLDRKNTDDYSYNKTFFNADKYLKSLVTI